MLTNGLQNIKNVFKQNYCAVLLLCSGDIEIPGKSQKSIDKIKKN